MSNKDRPLPRPKKTPFGINRENMHDGEDVPLTADRMALAMSQGKLDEFLKTELPDNEYARALAQMMMGMTGMMPAEKTLSAHPESGGKEPEGAINGITETLKKQFSEKSDIADTSGQDTPVIEKDILEELIKIASENHLSVEWLLFRAVRLYVEDYKKSGRL